MDIKEMAQIICGTANYRNKIIALFDKYEDIINNSEDYKLLCAYIAMFIGYQEEIMLLQSSNKYISTLPLTRIAIECYSTIKLLASTYRNDSILNFDNELAKKFLAYHDILQEINLFSSLLQSEQKDDIGKQYIDKITEDICLIFGEGYIKKDSSGKININRTKNYLMKKFKKQFPSERIPSNGLIIKAAFRNNKYMKNKNDEPFKKAQFMYIELCKACHNTVCSMKERMEFDIGNNKYITMNKEHRNNMAYMQINYNCLCDIHDEILQLFE